ncbi:MAG: SH3 domain-containing protein, partial [Mesorhizobium sp.]
ITFRDGKPAGSDSPDEFRSTREGSLNMIRVGTSERFEITDALALGE